MVVLCSGSSWLYCAVAATVTVGNKVQPQSTLLCILFDKFFPSFAISFYNEKFPVIKNRAHPSDVIDTLM